MPQPTKYGTAMVLTVVGKDGQEKALYVPYSEEAKVEDLLCPT